MMFTAVMPIALNGVRNAGGGVRRHTFWKEIDFVIPAVSDADAPVVMYFDAAFDERHRYLNRAEWGPYPSDGQQVVRYHEGSYWRQCMEYDIAVGELSSRVVDTDAFAASFVRPQVHGLVKGVDMAYVGPRKPTVRDEAEIVNIVATDLAHQRALSLERRMSELGGSVLIVDDTVYVKCAMPLVAIASDCVILDSASNFLWLLRVETDPDRIEKMSSKLSGNYAPVTDFDAALADASCGYDQAKNLLFNEHRRPVILRPDLLPDLDVHAWRGVNEMRQFNEDCYTMEIVNFAGPCGVAHRSLSMALAAFDAAGPAASTDGVEDSLEECTAAFENEYHGKHLENARGFFDNRPVIVPERREVPRP